MKGRAHTGETRAQVVAALLAGQGVNEIAQQYTLSKASVSRIKNSLAPELLEQVGTQKRESLADLVEEHLRSSLTAAKTIVEKLSNDSTWLKKQSASEIATLYGVITDKAIRILEAAENAQGE